MAAWPLFWVRVIPTLSPTLDIIQQESSHLAGIRSMQRRGLIRKKAQARLRAKEG